jgi:1-pyrroline-5-carboxylate dehydrogenase
MLMLKSSLEETTKAVGYFIEPTVIVTTNPRYTTMETELFGPVMTIFVYEDAKWEETLELVILLQSML